ncbi:hypothetical protein BK820_02770 [Acinetobacter sp. LCT-H3]|nr:hypothetical protein BK820_02770 [Acinetobacter sp. LCT-H3]
MFNLEPEQVQLIQWNIIDPVARLLVCDTFTDIIIMIPSVLMEDFLFIISHVFTIFDTDKTVALVFDLGSIEEPTNTEESGLFGHSLLIKIIKM